MDFQHISHRLFFNWKTYESSYNYRWRFFPTSFTAAIFTGRKLMLNTVDPCNNVFCNGEIGPSDKEEIARQKDSCPCHLFDQFSFSPAKKIAAKKWKCFFATEKLFAMDFFSFDEIFFIVMHWLLNLTIMFQKMANNMFWHF